MAIDYGQKRTGIAVTDELRLFATGLTTVPSASVIAFLQKYFDEQMVDVIVVGLPRQLDNTPSDAQRFTEPFVKKLQKHLEVILKSSYLCIRFLKRKATQKKKRSLRNLHKQYK